MKSLSTYQETLTFLYEQLPMFQRVGSKALKLDLTNIIELMQALGNPHEDLKCIHVAGTNGKGSVCHYIASILQEAGYTVGLYTSPHYKDYRERIRTNSSLISKTYVVRFINRLLSSKVMERLSPSFFEIGVAMAFCYFKDKEVDIAVIETGLGGRLDSTNIISPLLSVITNIGFDHQATLGNTLQLIAKEKAGIIKTNTPVVIGETQDETTGIFMEVSELLRAPISFAQSTNIITDIAQFSNIQYQQNNIKTAIVALEQIEGFEISQSNINLGITNVMSNTGYMGRWQQLSMNPMVIVDAAHNREGLIQLKLNLKTVTYDKLHIVLGMVGDKPLNKVLSLLPLDAKYYFCKADIPRGKRAIDLKEEAQYFNLKGNIYSSVRKALAAAKLSAKENDLVLVTGSIFTVAEVV